MADHPGSWRWRDDDPGLGHCLVDGNGMWLLTLDESGGCTKGPVLALVAAAPEMAQLLREEAVRWGDECKCPGSILPENERPKCRACRVRALLARIDRAKAGG